MFLWRESHRLQEQEDCWTQAGDYSAVCPESQSSSGWPSAAPPSSPYLQRGGTKAASGIRIRERGLKYRETPEDGGGGGKVTKPGAEIYWRYSRWKEENTQ